MPVAHALRHRNRALPDEAARCAPVRDFGSDRQAFRSGQIPLRNRTDAQPGQAEDRQRPHAGDQPVGAEDVDGGLDVGSLDFGAAQSARGYAILALASRRRTGAHRCATSARNCRRSKPKSLRKDFLSIVAARPRKRPQQAADRGWRMRRRRSASGARRQDAEPGPVHGEPDGECHARARSIRCWRAIPKSGR